MTSTEKLLQARGVSSLAELEGTGKKKPTEQRDESVANKVFTDVGRRDKWGQAEYGEHTERLTAETSTLEAQLTAAGVEFQKLENVGSDPILTCDTLESHVAQLRTKCSLNSIKISRSPDSHSKVVAGNDGGFGSAGRTGKSSSEPTATARVLARKGFASLADLESAKRVSPSAVSVESPSAEQVREAVAVLAAAIMAKPNCTQRVLAANGVNTLEELAELRRKQRGGKRLGKAVALLVFAALMFCGVARAQDPKAYTLLNGGTNNIAAGATNGALYIQCSEFNDLGLQATANGQSGTASNVQFYVYRTIASGEQESQPFSALQLRLSGTTTITAITNLDVKGAASIRIVPANTNAVPITNVSLVVRFKASKIKLSGS